MRSVTQQNLFLSESTPILFLRLTIGTCDVVIWIP
nr:MAG TPA: hypothetical protein [Caudoviricetes sp.]